MDKIIYLLLSLSKIFSTYRQICLIPFLGELCLTDILCVMFLDFFCNIVYLQNSFRSHSFVISRDSVYEWWTGDVSRLYHCLFLYWQIINIKLHIFHLVFSIYFLLVCVFIRNCNFSQVITVNLRYLWRLKRFLPKQLLLFYIGIL